MSKVELNDNIVDIMIKMSNGNPGAIQALSELIKYNAIIDPDSAFGELCSILFLDTNEIYGSDIYILWSDKCNRNIRRFIMLLRSTQLGIFSHQKLKELSLDQSSLINISQEEWDNIEEKVLEQLTQFKKEDV